MAISLIVFVVALWALIRLSRKRNKSAPRLVLAAPLMSATVRQFKPQLETVLDEHYDVWPCVALMDLINVEEDDDDVLPDLRLDFVLLDKTSGKARGVVQLRQKNMSTDTEKELLPILKQVKLPFVSLDVENDLSEEQLLAAIQSKLEPTIMLQGDNNQSEFKVYLEPNKSVSNNDIRLSLD